MISNIHTHTIYCDGADTPEALVETALSHGMEALGYSGHSYFPLDPGCVGMTPDRLRQYRTEILRLQKKYGSAIRLFTGIERDFDSPPESEDGKPFDYRIGSIHYMIRNQKLYSIDDTPALFLSLLHEAYQDDILQLVSDYMEKQLRMQEKMNPEIIGHFDLYRKFNDSLHYLDEEDTRYRSLVRDTLSQLLRQDPLIEVNTGGVSRGHMKEPYPSVDILKFLKMKKARLIITTDCHRADLLTAGYEEAVSLLRDLGFSSMWVMGRDGFREVPLHSTYSISRR